MKVIEKNLSNVIKIYEHKDIIVEIDDLLNASFELCNIHICYNFKIGILHIKDNLKNNEININISSVQYIDLEKEILHIQLDNSVNLKIRKR